MSYRIMRESQSSHKDAKAGSTEDLIVDLDSKDEHQADSTNWLARSLPSKMSCVFYFTLSTVMLVSGVACLIVASKHHHPVVESGNITRTKGQIEEQPKGFTVLKTFVPPMPPLLNISFASGPGHIFIFTGLQKADDWWAINFEGERLGKDIHYHFNPRPQTKSIVRNSKQNNRWSKEETALCKFPFKTGESFEVKVEVEETKFATYINGDFYFDFAVKMLRLSDIKYILFRNNSGAVEMQKVEVLQNITSIL